jgi:hypothetical protein
LKNWREKLSEKTKDDEEFEKVYKKYSELQLAQAASLHRTGAPDWDHEEMERICNVITKAIGDAKTQNRYAVCAATHILLTVMTETHLMAEAQAAEIREKDEDLN